MRFQEMKLQERAIEVGHRHIASSPPAEGPAVAGPVLLAVEAPRVLTGRAEGERPCNMLVYVAGAPGSNTQKPSDPPAGTPHQDLQAGGLGDGGRRVPAAALHRVPGHARRPAHDHLPGRHERHPGQAQLQGHCR